MNSCLASNNLYQRSLKNRSSCRQNRFTCIKCMEPEVSHRKNLSRQLSISTIKAPNTSKVQIFTKPSNVWKNVKNYSPLSKQKTSVQNDKLSKTLVIRFYFKAITSKHGKESKKLVNCSQTTKKTLFIVQCFWENAKQNSTIMNKQLVYQK